MWRTRFDPHNVGGSHKLWIHWVYPLQFQTPQLVQRNLHSIDAKQLYLYNTALGLAYIVSYISVFQCYYHIRLLPFPAVAVLHTYIPAWPRFYDVFVQATPISYSTKILDMPQHWNLQYTLSRLHHASSLSAGGEMKRSPVKGRLLVEKSKRRPREIRAENWREDCRRAKLYNVYETAQPP